MNGHMMVAKKAKLSRAGRWSRFLSSTRIAAALTGLAVVSPWQAQAQNNKHSCTIIVDNTPGLIRQNADATILASTSAGGLSARAKIIATNSSYRVSVDAPSGFSVFPNQGNKNTEISATFSSTGATSFFSSPEGMEQKIKKGTSNIKIDMTAKRLNGSFPSGNYAATVTLRCE